MKNKAYLANKNPLVYLIALTLITIPLEFKYNSISLILLAAYTLFTFSKKNVKFSLSLLIPVSLFLLMVLSASWSVNQELTIKSLPKALPLLIMPVIFMINGSLTGQQVKKVLNIFSIAIVLFGIYIILRSAYDYYETRNINVFFYHDLAGSVNAIYLSAVFSIAFFHLLQNHNRKPAYLICTAFVALCILLLSSKTLIAINCVLFGAYMVYNFRRRKKALIFVSLITICAVAALFLGKFKDRWAQEITANTTQSFEYVNKNNLHGVIYDVNIKDAWNVQNFGPDKRFTGTSFRVYQIRIFLEMLKSDAIFLKGYGFNASQQKIAEKGRQHNVFLGTDTLVGYQDMNFHNQYIQAFAELGIIGLLILLSLLIFNLKKAIKNKYFVHIAFAILMITLFLTESFIWRQRGVVLFTVLYCMLNTVAQKEKETL